MSLNSLTTAAKSKLDMLSFGFKEAKVDVPLRKRNTRSIYVCFRESKLIMLTFTKLV
jgi:hypothetical protein